MRLKNKLGTKKCPRCRERCSLNEPVCTECGLVFAKLINVSNKAGKKAVLGFKKDQILMTENWPLDAVRYKALLLCGFLGLFGAHNFYLGRYFKALFCLVFTCITIFFATMTVYPSYYELMMNIFAIPGAFPLIFWFYDFAMIAMGKYRIPVALDPKLVDKS